MIFSRNRGGSGRHARGDGTRPAGSGDGTPDTPAQGPYDITQAPADVQRLDLGSLQIPATDGVEVRVQANPDGGVQQVVLVHGSSALQLGVFAAPRSEGIWDDVRAEILASLTSEGATAHEEPGQYGVELRARVRTPDGPTDIRFVGIDGPRWMVRAVFQGPVAVDPAKAPALQECLTGLVVDRGKEAMPVSEPLPLRLPREVAEQAQRDAEAAEQQQQVDAADVAPTNGSRPGRDAPAGRRPAPRPPRGAS